MLPHVEGLVPYYDLIAAVLQVDDHDAVLVLVNGFVTDDHVLRISH